MWGNTRGGSNPLSRTILFTPPVQQPGMPKRKPKNPVYVLLMIVGTAFALTATAYGVMTVRLQRAVEASSGDQFFDSYGMWIMGVELTLLTLLTFAAIGTDDYWTRAAEDEQQVAAEQTSAENTSTSDEA